jgi:hypothetical protein
MLLKPGDYFPAFRIIMSQQRNVFELNKRASHAAWISWMLPSLCSDAIKAMGVD